MNSEKNFDELLQGLIDVLLLWDNLGVVYGHVEAPWVPTPINIVESVLDLISVSVGDVVVDLGCGDGRVVIEVAKRGAKGVCIEIDAKLIEIARNKEQQLNVEERIVFINDDMFKVDISYATIVYMYLTTNIINKLKSKILTELRPGTTIISLDYSLDWLEPVEIVEFSTNTKYHKIYIYIV